MGGNKSKFEGSKKPKKLKEKKHKILLVDDEQDILDLLKYNLEKENFIVYSCNNGIDAIEVAKQEVPDLVLLDVMMPEMDGMETCTELRQIEKLKHTLIAFLTARGEDYSQIAGFDAGADDYISKPVKPRVLISRIKALLRRKGGGSVQYEEIDGVLIDREKYLVKVNGKELNLPKKEFELLSLLTSQSGKVFTREIILNTIWGEDVIVGDRTIDVHIRKLREKIGDDYIKTIKGVGYKFGR
ncbi:MAG: DNA-binding response regulator [Crocinitomicaceae bacterium]|nr:DNA-binding response regulator [Crocinitomicaceae bacterium]|tara:strand:- start:692 stop:1417 length:726 start_codon:yes stop_codon:yes gene_type:complete